MNIKWCVDCEHMSLSTTISNFIALECYYTISSFVSKVSKVSFNKDTEVFNYVKIFNSSTHESELNKFSITQVAFDNTLDEECVPNSVLGESINIDNNTATPPRR